MDDPTTLLFAFSDFRVLDVTLAPNGGRRGCGTVALTDRTGSAGVSR